MAETTDELAALEGRLMQALTRIQAGLERWPDDVTAPAPEAETPAAAEEDGVAEAESAATIASLEAQLEEERTVNAQLQQRVKHIRKRQDEKIEAIEASLAKVQGEYEAAAAQGAKLRRTSADLRSALEDMQKAASEGGVDGHLINRAMMAELEALRAERAEDAREISELVDALEPLVAGEAGNA